MGKCIILVIQISTSISTIRLGNLRGAGLGGGFGMEHTGNGSSRIKLWLIIQDK